MWDPKILKIKLISSYQKRGNGSIPTDPVRMVSMYHLEDGIFIAEYDPYKEQSHVSPQFFEYLNKLKEK